MSNACKEMLPILTCYGDLRSSRRESDLETESPAAVLWTGWAQRASALNFLEESVGRSKDGILLSPKKEMNRL